MSPCARAEKASSIAGLFLAAASLVAGCAVELPHLVPAPAVFKDARLDFAAQVPEALRTTTLPIFYATTRAKSGDEQHYGNADGGGVTYGVARVRLGEPGLSWDGLVASDLASTVEKPRYGAVEAIDEMGRASADGVSGEAEARFIAAIDAQLARTRNRDLILYVHGYRVTFDEVSVQMGTFSHYLGQGATVTFQWPTGQMFWNYLTDCPRAERYVPDIERLLALVARTSAQYINVMAYSCGSPLLAAALSRLRARNPELDRAGLQRKYRLGNVIFVASDIDLKTFAREHVPPALDLAQQLIVYFSRIDRALGFSTLVAGASRLGRPDISELTPKDIERIAADPRFQAVDVSDVRGAHEMGGMKGHGYWYANSWISTDVALSLRYPIPPAKRCLEPRRPGGQVWTIPANYVECISDRLLATFPELRRH